MIWQYIYCRMISLYNLYWSDFSLNIYLICMAAIGVMLQRYYQDCFMGFVVCCINVMESHWIRQKQSFSTGYYLYRNLTSFNMIWMFSKYVLLYIRYKLNEDIFNQCRSCKTNSQNHSYSTRQLSNPKHFE